MSKTLFLNADGNPVSIVPLSAIPWRDAVKLYILDKVTILEVYENEYIHSQKMIIPKPSVVLAKTYYKSSPKVKCTRGVLMFRDDMRCQYCGKEFKAHELTLDHVYPKSKGGGKNFENIVCACKPCNTKKADTHNMKPFKAPHIPSYYEIVKKRKQHPVVFAHESWNKYLQWEAPFTIGSVKEHFGVTIGDL